MHRVVSLRIIIHSLARERSLTQRYRAQHNILKNFVSPSIIAIPLALYMRARLGAQAAVRLCSTDRDSLAAYAEEVDVLG